MRIEVLYVVDNHTFLYSSCVTMSLLFQNTLFFTKHLYNKEKFDADLKLFGLTGLEAQTHLVSTKDNR